MQTAPIAPSTTLSSSLRAYVEDVLVTSALRPLFVPPELRRRLPDTSPDDLIVLVTRDRHVAQQLVGEFSAGWRHDWHIGREQLGGLHYVYACPHGSDSQPGGQS